MDFKSIIEFDFLEIPSNLPPLFTLSVLSFLFLSPLSDFRVSFLFNTILKIPHDYFIFSSAFQRRYFSEVALPLVH